MDNTDAVSRLLPLITSRASMLRRVLADREAERVHLQIQRDAVLTQMADLDRQILALEGLLAMKEVTQKHDM